MGAFLGILNKIGLYRIIMEKSSCINCKKCSNICPVKIDVANIEKVTSSECINCMECITICPTNKKTLKPSILNKNFNPYYISHFWSFNLFWDN